MRSTWTEASVVEVPADANPKPVDMTVKSGCGELKENVPVKEIRVRLRMPIELRHETEFEPFEDDRHLQVHSRRCRQLAKRPTHGRFDSSSDVRLVGIEDVLHKQHVARRIAVRPRTSRKASQDHTDQESSQRTHAASQYPRSTRAGIHHVAFKSPRCERRVEVLRRRRASLFVDD